MMKGERRVSLRGEKGAQNELVLGGLVALRWGRGDEGGVRRRRRGGRVGGDLGSRDCKVGAGEQ